MKKLSIIAATLSLLAAPAIAADNGSSGAPTVRTQVVSFADLDLGTKQGSSELKRRVRVAVQNICGDVSPWDLKGYNQMKRCYRETGKAKSAEVATAIAVAQSPVRIADSR